jgi:enamine deaminase RidA (YjgF/YER057c/UK114 family)
MNDRITIASGAPWEALVGYARAVRVGPLVEVSGTVASEQGQVVAEGDLYGQTRFVLKKIGETLAAAGAGYGQVVRTRMYVTDISRWEEVARAHQEFFGDIRPCTTMVQVAALIDPRYLVEIEATAYLAD